MSEGQEKLLPIMVGAAKERILSLSQKVSQSWKFWLFFTATFVGFTAIILASTFITKNMY